MNFKSYVVYMSSERQILVIVNHYFPSFGFEMYHILWING